MEIILLVDGVEQEYKTYLKDGKMYIYYENKGNVEEEILSYKRELDSIESQVSSIKSALYLLSNDIEHLLDKVSHIGYSTGNLRDYLNEM